MEALAYRKTPAGTPAAARPTSQAPTVRRGWIDAAAAAPALTVPVECSPVHALHIIRNTECRLISNHAKVHSYAFYVILVRFKFSLNDVWLQTVHTGPERPSDLQADDPKWARIHKAADFIYSLSITCKVTYLKAFYCF